MNGQVTLKSLATHPPGAFRLGCAAHHQHVSESPKRHAGSDRLCQRSVRSVVGDAESQARSVDGDGRSGCQLGLALIAVVVIRVGISAGWFQMSHGWQLASGLSEVADGFALFLSVMFFENLMLGTWNMLPIPPMDGFSMLLFVLPEGRTNWFFEIRQQVGMMFPILMFGMSSYFWQLFTPVFHTVRGWVF